MRKAPQPARPARPARSARAAAPAPEPRLDRRVAIAVLVFCVAVVGVVYAQPILDGDLFWHLSYGEDMWRNRTLIPDHSLYSWMPVRTGTIYCTWLADLVLLVIYSGGGLAGLFVLRYAVLASVAVLLWRYARHREVVSVPVTWLVIFVVVLASNAGTVIKPELFSVLLFNLFVFTFLRGRSAALAGGNPRRWFFALPVLTVVWTNTHGGFVFAVPFVVAALTGELINRRSNEQASLPRDAARALWQSLGLCALAVNLSPYGPRYPLQLLGLFGSDRSGESSNAAYQSLFTVGDSARALFIYGAILAVVLVVSFVAATRRGVRPDWVLLLATLGYVPLYFGFVRTTFYWPAVGGYAAIELLASAPALERPLRNRRLQTAVLLVIAVVGLRDASSAYLAPQESAWLGFGIGYVNPVPEAAYVERFDLGPDLYNMFDSGGYLLWKLHPRGVQVMVDSRGFPYLDWLDERLAFTAGVDVPQFVDKYPADAAVIDLSAPGAWRAFVALPGWRPVFYGPTAAVFVRDPSAQLLASDDPLWDWRDGVRNANTALNVFDFAAYIGDYPTAFKMVDQVSGALDRQLTDGRKPDVLRYRAAYEAALRGDAASAADGFTSALRNRAASTRDIAIVGALQDLDVASRTGDANAIASARSRLAQVLTPVAHSG